MKLIDLYIYEVTRRLPEKNREDIALELQSTIEDMLPAEPTEDEVKQVLVQLGNPSVMASGYLDRPLHLIGPKYFDVYVSVLKIVLPIAMIIAFISLFGETIATMSSEKALSTIILTILGQGIWQLLSTAMQAAFWITLVFAVIERTEKVSDQIPVTMNFKKWTPEDLKNVSTIPQNVRIKKRHVFASLLWTAVWATVYFNASKLVGIYENHPDGKILVTPTFNQEVLLSFWLLIVLVITLEVALAIFKGMERRWTHKVAIANTVVQVVSLVVFIIIFSNQQVWNDSFSNYVNNLLNITNQMKNWAYQSIILTVVIIISIDIFEGFRKAHKSRKTLLKRVISK